MATVDEEEHAVLDRLTFDYHQKLQGKPQSHELVGAGYPVLLAQPDPPTCPSRTFSLGKGDPWLCSISELLFTVSPHINICGV